MPIMSQANNYNFCNIMRAMYETKEKSSTLWGCPSVMPQVRQLLYLSILFYARTRILLKINRCCRVRREDRVFVQGFALANRIRYLRDG